jgi:hypothetical protein
MFCRYYSYSSWYWQGTLWRFLAEFCGCLYHWSVCANLEHFVRWIRLYPGVWPPCSLCLITHAFFFLWYLKGSLYTWNNNYSLWRSVCFEGMQQETVEYIFSIHYIEQACKHHCIKSLLVHWCYSWVSRKCDSWGIVHTLQKGRLCCGAVCKIFSCLLRIVSCGLQGSWSSVISTWQG